MSPGPGLTRLTAELEAYRSHQLELEPVLRLYQAIFEIQESALWRTPSALAVPLAAALARLRSGQPILEGTALHLDYPLFRETAVSLGAAFSQTSGEAFPTTALLGLPQLQPGNLDSFVADLLANRTDAIRDFARGTSFNEATVFFFLHSLLTPFFQARAAPYQELVAQSGWHAGCCPFCGSAPAYARLLLADGSRQLYCPLCRSEWRFSRLACPFCGNEDQKLLRYCHREGDPGHRADVCERCQRYIKTTDERSLGREVIPQLEAAVTPGVDSLAESCGYQPGP